MDAMQRRGIERAQVAGWNNFRGTYVITSNGTVTPPVPLDLPKIRIFFKKYRDCREKIVFLAICEEACRKVEPVCYDRVIRPNPCPPVLKPICLPKPVDVCNAIDIPIIRPIWCEDKCDSMRRQL
jgi:hypothetical protein